MIPWKSVMYILKSIISRFHVSLLMPRKVKEIIQSVSSFSTTASIHEINAEPVRSTIPVGAICGRNFTIIVSKDRDSSNKVDSGSLGRFVEDVYTLPAMLY